MKFTIFSDLKTNIFVILSFSIDIQNRHEIARYFYKEIIFVDEAKKCLGMPRANFAYISKELECLKIEIHQMR